MIWEVAGWQQGHADAVLSPLDTHSPEETEPKDGEVDAKAAILNWQTHKKTSVRIFTLSTNQVSSLSWPRGCVRALEGHSRV